MRGHAEDSRPRSREAQQNDVFTRCVQLRCVAFLKARTRPNSIVVIHLNLQSCSDFNGVVVRAFTCLRLRAAAGNRDTAMLNNKGAELSRDVFVFYWSELVTSQCSSLSSSVFCGRLTTYVAYRHLLE